MLSPEDIKNGWTEESLAAYLEDMRASRIEAGQSELVPGNVVTEFQRPRPPVQMHNVSGYNPHRW